MKNISKTKPHVLLILAFYLFFLTGCLNTNERQRLKNGDVVRDAGAINPGTGCGDSIELMVPKDALLKLIILSVSVGTFVIVVLLILSLWLRRF